MSTKYCDDVCFCPVCGFEEIHLNCFPCKKRICPKCGSYMRRK